MTSSVTLGGFQFEGFGLPEEMPFGGDQMLAIHKLIGGQRIIDAMGRDDVPIEWTGRFMGSDGLSDAQQIDAMRVAGAAVSLVWSEFSYTVVIKSFKPKYKADYWIEYAITCEVVSDDATPTSSTASPTLDDQMSGDMSSASAIGSSVAGGLSSLVATMTPSGVLSILSKAAASATSSGAAVALQSLTGALTSTGTLSTLAGAVTGLASATSLIASLTPVGALATLKSAIAGVTQATTSSSFSNGSSGSLTNSPSFSI